MYHLQTHKFFLLFILLSASIVSAKAQYTYATTSFKIRISEACVIKITPSTPVTVSIYATVAGGTMANTPDNSSYLKLTSIVASSGKNKVEAAITTGKAPAGTLLKLAASPCVTSTGSGYFGLVDPQIILEPNVNKRIIHDIRNCYTGVGPTEGYNLTYTWELDPNNLSKLTAFTTNAAFVTFTISSQW